MGLHVTSSGWSVEVMVRRLRPGGKSVVEARYAEAMTVAAMTAGA
jgi:hypothetical protein